MADDDQVQLVPPRGAARRRLQHPLLPACCAPSPWRMRRPPTARRRRRRRADARGFPSLTTRTARARSGGTPTCTTSTCSLPSRAEAPAGVDATRLAVLNARAAQVSHYHARVDSWSCARAAARSRRLCVPRRDHEEGTALRLHRAPPRQVPLRDSYFAEPLKAQLAWGRRRRGVPRMALKNGPSSSARLKAGCTAAQPARPARRGRHRRAPAAAATAAPAAAAPAAAHRPRRPWPRRMRRRRPRPPARRRWLRGRRAAAGCGSTSSGCGAWAWAARSRRRGGGGPAPSAVASGAADLGSALAGCARRDDRTARLA